MGYLDLTNGFIYKDPVFRAKLDALGENDAYLKSNGWNDSTKGTFFQAAAPSGWTKDTSNNDRFLRITSGSGGGTGGSQSASSTISLAHSAHSLGTAPNHTHDLSTHGHSIASVTNGAGSGTAFGVMGLNSNGFLYKSNGFAGNSGTLVDERSNNASGVTSGSGGTHTHGGSSSGSALTDIILAYCDVIVASKNTGGGTYTDLTSQFHSGDKIDFDPFSSLAANDAYLNARIMPTSSVMVFGQATSPTGWTKQTSINDKFLRVVSGTGAGTGGSYAPSSAVTMNHTHTTPSDTGHTHTVPTHQHLFPTGASRVSSLASANAYIQADGSGILRTSGTSGATSSQTCYKDQTATDGSGTTADRGSHTHTLQASGTNWQIAYFDLIQCSKNSTGSANVYTDMTAVFAWKKLVSYQRLNKMAANDDYILYHTPESGTKSFFYMASPPTAWTRLTTQDDRALRMVSGSSGGNQGGGTQTLSTILPLQHTHTISTDSHSHGVGTHTHTLDSGAQTVSVYTNAGGGNYVIVGTIGGGTHVFDEANSGSSTNSLKNVTGTSSGSSDSVTHDHGGTSGSALTSVTLAYADVIYCSKD